MDLKLDIQHAVIFFNHHMFESYCNVPNNIHVPNAILQFILVCVCNVYHQEV